MSGTGGYQRPGTPSMVSGVGADSQRTDGQPPADGDMVQAAKYLSGEPYGQNKVLNQEENSAPLAGSVQPGDATPAPAQTQQAPDTSNFKPLSELGNPNVPLTHGMPFGAGDNHVPGVNPSSLKFNPETGTISSDTAVSGQYQNAKNVFKNLAQTVNSPSLDYLISRAEQAY